MFCNNTSIDLFYLLIPLSLNPEFRTKDLLKNYVFFLFSVWNFDIMVYLICNTTAFLTQAKVANDFQNFGWRHTPLTPKFMKQNTHSGFQNSREFIGGESQTENSPSC